MRGIEIGHEFPDEFSIRNERNKCQRSDALRLNGSLERWFELGGLDVTDSNRLRVPLAQVPRRIPLGSCAVTIGQTAPTDKPSPLLLVEQQDRGTVTFQSAQDCFNRGAEGLVGRGGSVEMIGKMKERLLMAGRIGERQFRLLSFRDVFNHTDKISKPAIGLADSADGLIDPDCGPVFANKAFFGGVLIEFAGSDFLCLGELDAEV